MGPVLSVDMSPSGRRCAGLVLVGLGKGLIGPGPGRMARIPFVEVVSDVAEGFDGGGVEVLKRAINSRELRLKVVCSRVLSPSIGVWTDVWLFIRVPSSSLFCVGPAGAAM